MAFSYNEETNKITLEPGDTGSFTVNVDWPRFEGEIALVLGVCNKDGEDVILKSWSVVDGMVAVELCNHDTRDLEPGNYKWQLRIVTDPEYDENGNVIAEDCTDKVISVFSGDAMPTFRITKKGARV